MDKQDNIKDKKYAICIAENLTCNGKYDGMHFAVTYYGEVMNGSHKFKCKRHVKKFIGKVFKEYAIIDWCNITNDIDAAVIAPIYECECCLDANDYIEDERLSYDYYLMCS